MLVKQQSNKKTACPEKNKRIASKYAVHSLLCTAGLRALRYFLRHSRLFVRFSSGIRYIWAIQKPGAQTEGSSRALPVLW